MTNKNMTLIKNGLSKNAKEWFDNVDLSVIHEVLENAYKSHIANKSESKVSIVRGKIGEDYIYEMLSSKYDIRSTGKIKHKGDMIISNNILLEVKNYSS